MDLTDMTHAPAITCSPDDTVTEIAMLMNQSGAGSVVVTDGKDHVVGIVTDRDIVVRGVAAGCEADMPIAEVMTREPVFVYEREDVFDAITRMVERGCRRLPVLDTGGAVVGVIALDDLLQSFARQIDMLANVVAGARATRHTEIRLDDEAEQAAASAHSGRQAPHPS